MGLTKCITDDQVENQRVSGDVIARIYGEESEWEKKRAREGGGGEGEEEGEERVHMPPRSFCNRMCNRCMSKCQMTVEKRQLIKKKRQMIILFYTQLSFGFISSS